jgi:hypothetical protein
VLGGALVGKGDIGVVAADQAARFVARDQQESLSPQIKGEQSSDLPAPLEPDLNSFMLWYRDRLI